jgi:hypothetical protein
VLTRPATAAALVAGLTGAAASAALAANTYILQKSDFPAGAISGPTAPAIVSGANGKDYSATYNFKAGPREEEVTSDVVVWKKASDAASNYRITLGGYTHLPHSTAYKLPAYGDEQVAEYEPEAGMGEVVVHKGNIVWMVTVQSCSHLAPAGCVLGTTPPKMTAAQALAELKKYALKQKARIGSG